MARVIVYYFAEKGEIFYDGLCDSLVQNGNDVLRVNIFKIVAQNKFKLEYSFKDNSIIDKILQFNPEIIMSYNNAFPFHLFPDEYIGKTYLFDADNPEYFWHKEEIKKHYSSLKFLGLQKDSPGFYQKVLGIEIPQESYAYFPAATKVQSSDITQDKNISFIGTNFPSEFNFNALFYNETGLAIYDEIKNNYFVNPEKLYATNDFFYKNLPLKSFKELFYALKFYYIKVDRIKSISCLCDLGLALYGVSWTGCNMFFDPEIAACFRDEDIITLQDNENVYNSSRIAVNISHPQATTAFSWRVMDIMASNACILMERKQDWFDLFGQYISQEVIDAIIYDDRYDMRRKAKLLLDDKKLRSRCVKECQDAIKQNGRWEHRFKILEEMSGVKIINLPKENATIEIIKKQEVLKSPNKLNMRSKFIQKCYDSSLIIGAAGIFALTTIPIIGSFIKRSKLFPKATQILIRRGS